MSSVARFTGRLRMTAGSPAYGCRVVLKVAASNTVITEAWTSSRGEFVLVVPPGRMAAGDTESAGFVLEVIDGTGTVLGSEPVVARPGQSTHVPLTGARKTAVTLPVALPLVRAHAAALVRPEALALIDAALALLAPLGSPAWDRYARAARRSLPPPGHVEELLELGWASLDGDPRAMADLREVLAVQAATMRRDAPMPQATAQPEEDDRRRPKVSYGVPKDQPAKGPTIDPVTTTGRLLSARGPSTVPEESDEKRREEFESAIPTDRLIALLVATVRVSRNSGERVAFFDGLHGLLSGLSTIDRLHRAALDVLQHRRIAPMRALLALLMAEVADASDLPLQLPGGVHSPGADPLLPTLVDPWWERLQQAVRDTATALRARDEASYRVLKVEPPLAQPGEVVTLSGTGFGTAGGEVVFDGAMPVEATSWTDTELRVVVPEGAQPGLISLRILEGVVRIRRRMVEFYREGSGLRFEGGRPQVRSILVDGRGEGTWVRPGDPVALSWTAVAGHQGRVTAQVRLRPTPGGRDTLLFDESDLPASGSRILAVPQVDTEHTLVVSLRVEAGAAQARREAQFPVAVPPKLHIEGIEVTQGIQRAPWDTASSPVPTVAGRDTFVRVYVSADREGFQDDRTRILDASLRIADRTLQPWPVGDQRTAGFIAGRGSAIDRSRDEDALLFRIPAHLCDGTRELTVEVSAEGSPPESPRAEARLTWTWLAARAVPIRVVRLVRADGSGPSPQDALATACRALELLPSPPDDVGVAWLDTLMLDGDPDRLLHAVAQTRDPASWEWLAHEVVGLPPDDREAHWLLVGDASTERVDAARNTALIPVGVDPALDPAARAAGARALAGLLEPDLRTQASARVTDVPFDPCLLRTVVDPSHGVHDLDTPTGTAWTSPARWRRLLERA